MELLTKSRLKTKRRCSRLHYFRYGEGYRPVVQREPLTFGTLMHTALESWWKHSLHDFERYDHGFQQLDAVFDAIDRHPIDEFSKVRARELMRGYHFRWKDEPYDVLAVEEQFRTPLIHPLTGERREGWEIAGKVDVVLRDRRDGRVLVMEHKSSGEDIRGGSLYWVRLRIDEELPIYMLGAKSLGYEVQGGLYDVIAKPWAKPYKATTKPRYTKEGKLYKNQREHDETPEEYQKRLIDEIAEDPNGFYARAEVKRLEQELEDALIDAWGDLDAYELELKKKNFPRDPGGCDKYGSLCEFFGVCTGSQSLDDPALFVKSDVIHPELEDQNEQDHDNRGD